MAPLRLPLPFAGLGSETQLRALADALPHGLFTIDVNGAITFWSEGAERLTGYTRAEALGKPCSLLAGDSIQGCGCGDGPIRCGLVERGRSSKCCTIRTKAGTELRIIKNAVPLLGADGTPVGALESFAEVEDVSAFRGRAQVPAAACRAPFAPAGDFCGLTGRHPEMRELYRMIELVARSSATVIVLGESGSGKDLVARAIHALGPRASRPFVRVSCAALHDPPAGPDASGAASDVRGLLAGAAGGTVLLDEVGDLSPGDQAALLRVCEQRASGAPADPAAPKGEVRLLCSTHRDLRQLVAEGRFRADLYFRLAVFPLRVPPLRDRVEDLPLLAEAILARRGSSARLSPGALAALGAHPWPGNVRELENVLEVAALQAHEGEIRPEHLPADVTSASPAARAQSASRDERARTLEALAAAGWNRTRAAEALGISRVTLWKRIRRHGLAAGGAGGAERPDLGAPQAPRRERA